MDYVRLEGRRHVASEGLHLLGATLAGVEDGHLQRHERHVVGHVSGGELPTDPGKDGDPFLDLAETCSDAPLRPYKPPRRFLAPLPANL